PALLTHVLVLVAVEEHQEEPLPHRHRLPAVRTEEEARLQRSVCLLRLHVAWRPSHVRDLSGAGRRGHPRAPIPIIARSVSLSVAHSVSWPGRSRPCKARERVGRTGRVLSSLMVGGVFLFLAFRHVPLDELGGAFQQLDARWFVPAIALSLLLQVF